MADRGASFLSRALSSFLTERSGLTGNGAVRFAEVMHRLVEGVAEGHSCLELNGEELALLQNSRLVSVTATTPLVLVGRRLYLARYYRYERQLAASLKALGQQRYPLSREEFRALEASCLGDQGTWNDEQRQAVYLSLSGGLCLVSGGPGTGKTSTAIGIIGLLLARYGPGFRIALAAPTGKAAVRLRDSVAASIAGLKLSESLVAAIPPTATTIHRLLGVRQFQASFRHDRQHPLPWDAVLVDEASMIDLALMTRLCDALKPGARLILLGDKDQLASVEAGTVFADCVAICSDCVAELHQSYRFNQTISRFAMAVRSGNSVRARELAAAVEAPEVHLAAPDWEAEAAGIYSRYLEAAARVRDHSGLEALFEQFNRFRILCAVRRGVRGVSRVNRVIDGLLAGVGHHCCRQEWYPGRPVMVHRNDYQLRIFNGDIGICLDDFDGDGRVVWFPESDGGFRGHSPARLPEHETAWAMTVHKSQGSEYDQVLVLLPDEDLPILSRELLYTAATRARHRLTLLAEQELLAATVNRRVRRFGGLADFLGAGARSDQKIS